MNLLMIFLMVLTGLSGFWLLYKAVDFFENI